MNKTDKFGIGVLLGTVLGGIAGLFLSPQSGKENREFVVRKIQELQKVLEEQHIADKVQQIFGEVTEESKKIFVHVNGEIRQALADLKKTVDEIDKEKYVALVEDILAKVKSETQESAERLGKLRDYFIARWHEVKEESSKTKTA